MDPLATVGELENHLQREVDQGQGEQAVTLASGAVRAYCGWDLARESTTLYADGTGSSLLSLPTLYLIDVTALRIDGETVDPAGIDMPTWSRKGQLFRWIGFPRHAVVEADVVHGYNPIPDLVKLVVLDVAACNLNNPQQLASVTVGQVSKTWPTGAGYAEYGLSSLHAALLDRYRLF